MKKFFERCLSEIAFLCWAAIIILWLGIAVVLMLAGLMSFPAIIANIVLAACNIWYAPWWVYFIEILGTIVCWIAFINFIRDESFM